MSNNGPQRPGKSVRWTGRDEHRHHEVEDEDYFSFRGGSANQPLNAVDDSSSSSSSSEEDPDEHAMHVRATTRANTWFNRLRQEDTESEDEGNGNEGAQRFSQPPQIDNNMLHPYSYLMDIGAQTGGGLAPGGAERPPDEDPLDAEYTERRNRILALAGSHSTPATPQEELTDPLDPEAIPLHSIRPPQDSFEDGDDDEEDEGPMYMEIPRRSSSNRQNTDEMPKTPEIRVTSDVSSSDNSTEKQNNDVENEADRLRKALEEKQRERTHRMEEIIRARKEREEKRQQRRHNREASEDGEKLGRVQTHASQASQNSSSSSTKDNEDDAKEEEELKQLEEAAKQEAEDEAKMLVMSHLNTNLLDPNNNKDGYVENNQYLLDAGMMNEDIKLDDEKDGHEHSEEAGKETSAENEKKEQKDINDSSDSDDDSDDGEQNKHVNLRGDPDYVPPPKKVKEGVLGSLLRLYAGQEEEDNKSVSSTPPSPSVSETTTPLPSPGETPISTPHGSPGGAYTPTKPGYVMADDLSSSSTKLGKKWKRPSYFRTRSTEDALGRDKHNRPKWYKTHSYSRTNSISELASTGLAAATNAAHGIGNGHSTPSGTKLTTKFKGKVLPFDPYAAEPKHDRKSQKDKEARKQAKKAEQAERERKKALKRARLAEQARITVHIADVLQRQRFLLRFGRALMLFGAPSHRLEEYLKITARVLEIDAQFLYMPGTMLVSFGDATTHTSETKLLRVTQGLNLTKLHATHLIYKEVVHDLMSLEEASSHIDHLLRSKNLYPWWLVVFFYGIACVCCGMFAYGAWWTDMPIIFVVGSGVGFLQFWCQPKSDLYANVFEVSSSVVVSMIGRAFGSIGRKTATNGERVFCFAAITQASLALILPGYIILVGALELQTKNLVAGSVRMFYANIYSLFLSFGMTLGSTIFGWIYSGATTETTCQRTINPLWKILFVPAATLFMAVVNQAGPRQLPIMVVIGSAGFTVQYFVQKKVENAASFTSAIGAFTMGVIGNLYSRVGHGLAFAAMLPGIFVLVPSGIAAQDSFVAGLKTATQIVNGSKSVNEQSQSTSTSISELGNSMTQVAVGIVVGLFAATLVVYPLGMKKKRSGLFTF